MGILKTEVDESGFTRMFERWGRDCLPEQFIREYIQNSVEAIQRTPDKSGNIVIDYNDRFYSEQDVYKLSFVDNGVGMTPDDMRKHIKDLSSSGAENKYENYGMGAKISSVTRNKYGILYESWVDGVGYQVLMKYDEEVDAYGLFNEFQINGEYSFYSETNDEYKPGIIDKHGTRVTLLGQNENDDTMDVPEGVEGSREAWLAYYANSRFFQIPEGLSLDIRIGYHRDKSNTRHNYLRKVSGQNKTLNDNSRSHGVVNFKDFNTYWWIIDENKKGHGRENIKGHTALLNQDELFDIKDSRSNRAESFGIIFGKQNVVLYIEPSPKIYLQKSDRTALVKKDGSSLPIDDWADQFRKKMPKELETYMQEIVKKSSLTDKRDSIIDRLKEIRKLFKISRYKPSEDGHHFIDEEDLTGQKTGGTHSGSGTAGQTSSGEGDGEEETLLSSILKSGGKKAKEASPNPFPEFIWVSLSDGTRDVDEMDDRAATYLSKDNLIKGNKDFQGFIDLIDHFMKIYRSAPGADTLIPEVIYELFEQQLIETVAGSLSLKGRKQWNADDFDHAVSQESLTAAVMSRYYIIHTAQKRLKRKLSNYSH